MPRAPLQPREWSHVYACVRYLRTKHAGAWVSIRDLSRDATAYYREHYPDEDAPAFTTLSRIFSLYGAERTPTRKRHPEGGRSIYFMLDSTKLPSNNERPDFGQHWSRW